MISKFTTALVLDDRLYRQVVEIIRDGDLQGNIERFDDIESFRSCKLKEFSLLIYTFDDVNRAREVISSLTNLPQNIPVVFIYREGKLSLSDYKDLIINGAAGLVPDSNLKSLFQHILRLQEEYLSGNDVKPLFDELLENYFDDNESLVSLINSDLKYESVNESFRKYHNLRRDELQGLCPSNLWGEDIFNSEIEAKLRKSLNGEVIRYKAYFGKGKSGTKCYEVVYRPFKPKGSRKSYSLVETRDITDLEESLKLAGELARTNNYYTKYIPFGIFECNTKGDILSANETFYNILEIEKNIKKVNLSNYSKTDKRFFSYLETVHEGESSTFSQIPMITGKGEEIYARISSHARHNVSGEIIVNATLEDNTREVLLEKKLNQSQKIETLGTLAGGIAHDFNTILTTITGYSELSMDEVDEDSDIYSYQSKILHSVNRAEGIVNQMLTFSRQIEDEHVPVKIEEVVEEVCKFMQSALPYNIRLESELSEINAYADGDPTQLFRVFLNMMTNSMQAMEKEGGKLSVRTFHSSSGSREYGNITIEDTGTGIDNTTIDRIYEPFFTTKEPGEGTGMGLAVAHGIISKMGGEVMVESKEGEGTLFTLRIPVYSQEEISEKSTTDIQSARNVLYADNNLYFSRTVSLALERLGYNVRLASNIMDINSYLEKNTGDDDIIFFRCSFDPGITDDLLDNLLEVKKNSRLVLISKSITAKYRRFSKFDKNRTSILFEPVTLRDIVSSIQNTC